MAYPMAVKDPTTSIQLHESIRQFLDALYTCGQSYDVLILEMAEVHFPPTILKQLKRRFAVLGGPSSDEVFRRTGL